jgi:hypothetical protein
MPLPAIHFMGERPVPPVRNGSRLGLKRRVLLLATSSAPSWLRYAKVITKVFKVALAERAAG